MHMHVRMHTHARVVTVRPQDQDHWWLSGIHRHVWLCLKPAEHIADFDAQLKLTGELAGAGAKPGCELHAIVHVRLPPGASDEDAGGLGVSAVLLDPAGHE
eukprot:5332186-Pleurochrysis_carterae.AAC.1